VKISRREVTLGLATLVLVLGGLGFFVGRSMVAEWDKALRQRHQVAEKKKEADALIAGRETVVQQLGELEQALPRFRLDQQVNAELLKTIQKTADENQLSLKRLLPEKEQEVGDLSEVAIECHWEGSLEQLVRFLYAVQVQGAMLDIRELKIDPAQGQAGRLKGTFTVFCAFKRESGEEPPVEAPATGEPTTEGASS
jgi:Tfp pilus assembly protein PilO